MTNILFPDGPHYVEITPLASKYNVGDQINCTSDGHPPPSIHWQDVDTERKMEGAILMIDNTFTNKESRWKCVATNLLTEIFLEKNITFYVYGNGRTFENFQRIYITFVFVSLS